MYPELNFPVQPEHPNTEPPMVYIHKEPAWKYKHLSYDLQAGAVPDEDMLNELGSAGWELAGMFAQNQTLHLYFKRSG